jgi:hypothetical protein
MLAQGMFDYVLDVMHALRSGGCYATQVASPGRWCAYHPIVRLLDNVLTVLQEKDPSKCAAALAAYPHGLRDATWLAGTARPPHASPHASGLALCLLASAVVAGFPATVEELGSSGILRAFAAVLGRMSDYPLSMVQEVGADFPPIGAMTSLSRVRRALLDHGCDVDYLSKPFTPGIIPLVTRIADGEQPSYAGVRIGAVHELLDAAMTGCLPIDFVETQVIEPVLVEFAQVEDSPLSSNPDEWPTCVAVLSVDRLNEADWLDTERAREGRRLLLRLLRAVQRAGVAERLLRTAEERRTDPFGVNVARFCEMQRKLTEGV